jgi:hypothetical protein
VNYMYAIHFANATFAVANLAHASNFPSVETARNKGRSGRTPIAAIATCSGETWACASIRMGEAAWQAIGS